VHQRPHRRPPRLRRNPYLTWFRFALHFPSNDLSTSIFLIFILFIFFSFLFSSLVSFFGYCYFFFFWVIVLFLFLFLWVIVKDPLKKISGVRFQIKKKRKKKKKKKEKR
jgi:uncharacterized membrane protein